MDILFYITFGLVVWYLIETVTFLKVLANRKLNIGDRPVSGAFGDRRDSSQVVRLYLGLARVNPPDPSLSSRLIRIRLLLGVAFACFVTLCVATHLFGKP